MRQGQISACEHARESVLQCVSACARERVRESLVQSFSVLFFSQVNLRLQEHMYFTVSRSQDQSLKGIALWSMDSYFFKLSL